LAQHYFTKLGPARLERSWLITAETKGSYSKQMRQSIGIHFDAYRLVDDLPHPIDGTSVKLFAPVQEGGTKPCAR
jgi:hypothetical protein